MSVEDTVFIVWFIVPRTATDGFCGQGGSAREFLAWLAHTFCMNLPSFTSKAVGFVGRLPKMRKTVFGFDIVSERFSKGWRREKWNGLNFGLERKSHTFRTVVDARPGKGLEIREGGVIQITPSRDAPGYRVIGHNCHWTLVDDVGVHCWYLLVVVGDGPAVGSRAEGILLLHLVD